MCLTCIRLAPFVPYSPLRVRCTRRGIAQPRARMRSVCNDMQAFNSRLAAEKACFMSNYVPGAVAQVGEVAINGTRTSAITYHAHHTSRGSACYVHNVTSENGDISACLTTVGADAIASKSCGDDIDLAVVMRPNRPPSAISVIIAHHAVSHDP